MTGGERETCRKYSILQCKYDVYILLELGPELGTATAVDQSNPYPGRDLLDTLQLLAPLPRPTRLRRGTRQPPLETFLFYPVPSSLSILHPLTWNSACGRKSCSGMVHALFAGLSPSTLPPGTTEPLSFLDPGCIESPYARFEALTHADLKAVKVPTLCRTVVHTTTHRMTPGDQA